MKTPNTLFVGIVALLMLAGLVLLPRLPENAQPSSLDTSADIRFTASGDFGNSKHTTKALKRINYLQPDFHIGLGDFSYDELNPETAWCSYVSKNLGDVPFKLVPGNHEEDGQTDHINGFKDCLQSLAAASYGSYPEQYYFDYKNLARFIVISPDLTINDRIYSYQKGSEEHAWLKKAIKEADAKWLIVAMHKNCISVGEKTCEIGQELFNFLIAQKVNLILQAHDHTYQRSKPLIISKNCPAIKVGIFNQACILETGQKGGTVLVIAGTGGRSYYDLNLADNEHGYFARVATKPVYGFAGFEIWQDRLVGHFVASSASDFSDTFIISR